MWTMIHSDRWKWCNMFLSHTHSHLGASQYNRRRLQVASERLDWTCWVPCYTVAERGETTHLPNPLQGSNVDSSIPRLLPTWIPIISFHKPMIMIWKRLSRKLGETTALSVCWMVGPWYLQYNDRWSPQTIKSAFSHSSASKNKPYDWICYGVVYV